MSNNTCPYCGSAEDSILSGRFFRKYKCDSTKFIDRYTAETRLHQSEACMRIELAALRNHNRDLQQAYDHVLECEQNRCREVVEFQDRLAEVTAERDDLQQRIDAAPVWYMENGGFVSGYAASFRSDKHNLNRVRLVPDPETPNA